MSNSDREPVSFPGVTVIRATSKALLVCIDESEVWIPKSQLCDESEIDAAADEGDEGELVVPEWMAIEKGLV